MSSHQFSFLPPAVWGLTSFETKKRKSFIYYCNIEGEEKALPFLSGMPCLRDDRTLLFNENNFLCGIFPVNFYFLCMPAVGMMLILRNMLTQMTQNYS